MSRPTGRGRLPLQRMSALPCRNERLFRRGVSAVPSRDLPRRRTKVRRAGCSLPDVGASGTAPRGAPKARLKRSRRENQCALSVPTEVGCTAGDRAERADSAVPVFFFFVPSRRRARGAALALRFLCISRPACPAAFFSQKSVPWLP